MSDAAGQVGNGFERLGVQRHLDPPSRLHEALPHELFSLLYPLLLALSTCPDKISQQSHEYSLTFSYMSTKLFAEDV